MLNKRKKIGIIGKGFMEWEGGRQLLYLLISALSYRENSDYFDVYLFVNIDRPSFKEKIKNFIKKLSIGIIRSSNSLDLSKIVDQYFKKIVKKNNIIYFKNKDIDRVILNNKIDIIFPSSEFLDSSTINWVGYIFDLQHKGHPEFFSKREVDKRNVFFGNMIYHSKYLLVNSFAVKKDIDKYYPMHHSEIFVLPFSPILNKGWLINTFAEVKKRYKIPNRYFIISNQFWIHKDHEVAIDAFNILVNNNKRDDIHLVCTGDTQDYRNPDYFNKLLKKIKYLGLRNNIHILGLLPREDQIQIMRNSIAVIQPTLFEGGPGGGSVYNAIALGLPVIISDIPINREVGVGDITYFKAGDYEDLANKMFSAINSKKNFYSNEALLEMSRIRIEKLSLFLRELINNVKS